MEVTRTATGLTVNIPDDVAKSLNLKVGDAVNVVPVTPHSTSPAPYRSNATEEERREALKYLSEIRIELPEGWKFNREEANER
jgi:antitoxin MazE